MCWERALTRATAVSAGSQLLVTVPGNFRGTPNTGLRNSKAYRGHQNHKNRVPVSRQVRGPLRPSVPPASTRESSLAWRRGVLLLCGLRASVWTQCLGCPGSPRSLTSSEKPRTTCRRFRLVSPSRLAVSMWHSPSGSLEDSSRMSAGMISLQRRRTKSPTRISFQNRFTYCFSSLRKRLSLTRLERGR